MLVHMRKPRHFSGAFRIMSSIGHPTPNAVGTPFDDLPLENGLSEIGPFEIGERSDAATNRHVDLAARQSNVGQFGIGHVVQLIFRTMKFNPFAGPMNDPLKEGVLLCSSGKQFTGRRLHRRVGHVDLLRLALIT
nr:hypothetical protein [Azospirillum sp. B506]